MLKRISAYILDVILLAVVIVGFAFLLSSVTGYDAYNEKPAGKTCGLFVWRN